jgi:Arc/MetJ-type ribon-helix-helix transcriptional regulator
MTRTRTSPSGPSRPRGRSASPRTSVPRSNPSWARSYCATTAVPRGSRSNPWLESRFGPPELVRPPARGTVGRSRRAPPVLLARAVPEMGQRAHRDHGPIAPQGDLAHREIALETVLIAEWEVPHSRTIERTPEPNGPGFLMHHHGGTSDMDTVPAKLTPRLVEEIDELVREGWYANRSELIRDAVREAIRRARTQRLERAIKEDVAWGLGGRK